MYAVVTTVNIASGQFEAGRKDLHDTVVPRVSKAPGFVKGVWLVRDDHAQGLSTIVFKTKQDAENAMSMVRKAPMAAGVTLNTIEVREVVAEA
jgi:hypothetical protein